MPKMQPDNGRRLYRRARWHLLEQRVRLYNLGGDIRWPYALGAPFRAEPLASPLRNVGRVLYLKANGCSSCKLVYIDLARQH